MYYLEANIKKTSIPPENGPPSTNKIKTIAVVKAGNSRALIFHPGGFQFTFSNR